MKPRRIIDLELLDTIKQMPCFFCGREGPSDPHHLKTRGAGGGDTEDNVIPLCRKHHTAIHQEGLSKTAWKWPKLKEWLTQHKRVDLLSKI